MKFGDGSKIFQCSLRIGGSEKDNGVVQIYSGRVQTDLELKGDKSQKDFSQIMVVDYVWVSEFMLSQKKSNKKQQQQNDLNTQTLK